MEVQRRVGWRWWKTNGEGGSRWATAGSQKQEDGRIEGRVRKKGGEGGREEGREEGRMQGFTW